MKKQNPELIALIESQIQRLSERIAMKDIEDPTIRPLVNDLEDLVELYNSLTVTKLDKILAHPSFLGVLGSLAGIGMILAGERSSVITSKAFSRIWNQK